MNALLVSFFCSIILFSTRANTEVRVAFIEIISPSGRPVILEPGGRFAHVAISVQGGWLHTHSLRGVEIISNDALHRLGAVTLLELPWLLELNEEKVSAFLGKPYDRTYSWSNQNAYYCSELVGKILNLQPLPMTFSAAAWASQFSNLRRDVGLSPDDVFQLLVQKLRHRPLNCSALSSHSP